MFNANMPNKDDLPTTAQLLRSTGVALVIAVVALFGAVLPAEYGVDPTGAGRLLGLTQMGEIKQQLAEEAATGEPAPVPVAVVPEVAEPIVEVSTPEPSEEMAEALPVWTDEVSLTLAPDEAAEVKLVMLKGAGAKYEWSVNDGNLNCELHADFPDGDGFHSYKKARGVTGDTGEFTAAFDGAHGWYWRNRSGKDVTVTLRVRGDYSEVKRMM
ncbi:MAG: transmembrane anchor protein [Rhodobacterales bacterium]|nr:transmembrane anchor protein [Rhodobacterales bacterium]